MDDGRRDAPGPLVEEEAGIARDYPAVLADEKPELIRILVPLVEQILTRDVIALVADGGVEHGDELVQGGRLRLRDPSGALGLTQPFGRLARGALADEALQVLD